jgi:hypothetical protein
MMSIFMISGPLSALTLDGRLQSLAAGRVPDDVNHSADENGEYEIYLCLVGEICGMRAA